MIIKTNLKSLLPLCLSALMGFSAFTPSNLEAKYAQDLNLDRFQLAPQQAKPVVAEEVADVVPIQNTFYPFPELSNIEDAPEIVTSKFFMESFEKHFRQTTERKAIAKKILQIYYYFVTQKAIYNPLILTSSKHGGRYAGHIQFLHGASLFYVINHHTNTLYLVGIDSHQKKLKLYKKGSDHRENNSFFEAFSEEEVDPALINEDGWILFNIALEDQFGLNVMDQIDKMTTTAQPEEEKERQIHLDSFRGDISELANGLARFFIETEWKEEYLNEEVGLTAIEAFVFEEIQKDIGFRYEYSLLEDEIDERIKREVKKRYEIKVRDETRYVDPFPPGLTKFAQGLSIKGEQQKMARQIENTIKRSQKRMAFGKEWGLVSEEFYDEILLVIREIRSTKGLLHQFYSEGNPTIGKRALAEVKSQLRDRAKIVFFKVMDKKKKVKSELLTEIENLQRTLKKQEYPKGAVVFLQNYLQELAEDVQAQIIINLDQEDEMMIETKKTFEKNVSGFQERLDFVKQFSPLFDSFESFNSPWEFLGLENFRQSPYYLSYQALFSEDAISSEEDLSTALVEAQVERDALDEYLQNKFFVFNQTKAEQLSSYLDFVLERADLFYQNLHDLLSRIPDEKYEEINKKLTLISTQFKQYLRQELKEAYQKTGTSHRRAKFIVKAMFDEQKEEQSKIDQELRKGRDHFLEDLQSTFQRLKEKVTGLQSHIQGYDMTEPNPFEDTKKGFDELQTQLRSVYRSYKASVNHIKNVLNDFENILKGHVKNPLTIILESKFSQDDLDRKEGLHRQTGDDFMQNIMARQEDSAEFREKAKGALSEEFYDLYLWSEDVIGSAEALDYNLISLDWNKLGYYEDYTFSAKGGYKEKHLFLDRIFLEQLYPWVKHVFEVNSLQLVDYQAVKMTLDGIFTYETNATYDMPSFQDIQSKKITAKSKVEAILSGGSAEQTHISFQIAHNKLKEALEQSPFDIIMKDFVLDSDDKYYIEDQAIVWKAMQKFYDMFSERFPNEAKKVFITMNAKPYFIHEILEDEAFKQSTKMRLVLFSSYLSDTLGYEEANFNSTSGVINLERLYQNFESYFLPQQETSREVLFPLSYGTFKEKDLQLLQNYLKQHQNIILHFFSSDPRFLDEKDDWSSKRVYRQLKKIFGDRVMLSVAKEESETAYRDFMKQRLDNSPETNFFVISDEKDYENLDIKDLSTPNRNVVLLQYKDPELFTLFLSHLDQDSELFAVNWRTTTRALGLGKKRNLHLAVRGLKEKTEQTYFVFLPQKIYRNIFLHTGNPGEATSHAVYYLDKFFQKYFAEKETPEQKVYRAA